MAGDVFVLVASLPAIGAIICPVTDLTAIVAPIGVKFWIMVHIRPGHKVSLWGGAVSRSSPKWGKERKFLAILAYQKGFLKANVSKTVSRSLKSARRELPKL